MDTQTVYLGVSFYMPKHVANDRANANTNPSQAAGLTKFENHAN